MEAGWGEGWLEMFSTCQLTVEFPLTSAAPEVLSSKELLLLLLLLRLAL